MWKSDLIKIGSDRLKEAGKEDAEFDARCIAEHVIKPRYVFGLQRFNVSEFFSDERINKLLEDSYLTIVEDRANGEPLQYLLGEWEFMGLTFKVGEGVLIPRPETEMLVEFSIDFLKDKENPIVFDLCSGSGCIAISVAKFCPNATVYAVEKSEEAYKFLVENIELNKAENVHPVKGDIFDKSVLCDVVPDLILSNPPYVRTNEISSLQEEVQKEPVMALDGGEDGYDFYRVIAADWIKRLKKGGMLAVECAEDQTKFISDLFSENSAEVKTYNDYSGLPRGVIAVI